jgi:hypothetical protein
MLLLVAGAVACSDDSDGDGTAGGGESGTSGQSAAGAGAGGTTGDGGRAGGSSGGRSGAGSGGTSSGMGGTGTGGTDAGAGDGGSTQTGVCGQRGEATVNATEFTGFEEFFLISEEGFGEDICIVRFDVARVGDAPPDCSDDGVACLWSHTVEFSNPSVVLDEDGVCADSELALDAAAIAEIDGSRASYGFVAEFAGHDRILMKYDEAMGIWNGYGNATYDEAAEAFRFDRRDGFCDY